MAGQIVATASITAGDRIADGGCGTGLFARRILDLAHPGWGIACVDPSPAMLAQLPALAGAGRPSFVTTHQEYADTPYRRPL